MDWLTSVGLGLVLLAIASYLVLLFVIHDFTYKTWLFDGVVCLGVIIAGVGLAAGGFDCCDRRCIRERAGLVRADET
jgi:hypothetical protein